MGFLKQNELELLVKGFTGGKSTRVIDMRSKVNEIIGYGNTYPTEYISQGDLDELLAQSRQSVRNIIN